MFAHLFKKSDKELYAKRREELNAIIKANRTAMDRASQREKELEIMLADLKKSWIISYIKLRAAELHMVSINSFEERNFPYIEIKDRVE